MKALAVVACLLWGAVLGVAGWEEAAPAFAPSNARERFAVDLLARLGNTAPTAETVAFVVAWQGGENTDAAYNPLATTQEMPGDTCFNKLGGKCGVRNYASYEDGLEATVRTLTNGYYPKTLEGLVSNQPTIDDAELGTWGTGAGNVRAQLEMVRLPAPASDVRTELVDYALSLQGTPYISGGSASYRAGQTTEGGDCSATMQHVYAHVTGIDISESTFSQWPRLQPIDESDLLPGDLWYGVFPDDEHTGMVADVDGDGTWDLIHNGADEGRLHVTYDFLTTYLGIHTKGFRRAL